MIPVRAMQRADAPAAVALLNEIIRIGGTTAYQTPRTEAEFLASNLDGPQVICCHVALDPAGEVAGFQVLKWSKYVPETCADIASFARQSNRVRGVGAALFPVTCAAARAAGATEINATIRADNAPGLAYYSKMGLVDFEVEVGVPLTDGTPVDRVSKRFDLSQS